MMYGGNLKLIYEEDSVIKVVQAIKIMWEVSTKLNVDIRLNKQGCK